LKKEVCAEEKSAAENFGIVSVDAATPAMWPIALNGEQRLIGDVEQAAQVIAPTRVLFGCDDFWVTRARIHQP
jgi:hypothetical protein